MPHDAEGAPDPRLLESPDGPPALIDSAYPYPVRSTQRTRKRHRGKSWMGRRSRKNMKIKSALLIGAVLILSGVLYAQGPSVAAPMTEKEVVKELKGQGADQLIKDVGQRGVDFELDPDIEKGLRKAKATDEVIKAVKNAGPKARANAKAAGVGPTGPTVGVEEGKAFDALKTELDPDRAIALAEDFATKYPNSPVM